MGSSRYRSSVLDSCPEISTPISSIARMASGLMWVASMPALCASKRSPARWRSSPSAIWLRAELWVHTNRTLARFSPASAAATTHAPLLWTGQQAIRGLAEQLSGGLPVEGVEAPLPAPLLAHQPGVLELPHVVRDLRLAHAEVVLELADADALVPLARRYTRAGEVAAASTVGHHAEHPHPYGVGESPAQGDEPVHPFRGAVPTDAVLFYDPELFSAHRVPARPAC